MSVQRLSIVVRGRVQGVGFRFFTAHSARKYGISGWVRNSYDGGVEMEAQGPSDTLESFKSEIHEGPVLARVNEMTVIELPVSDGEQGFEVRH